MEHIHNSQRAVPAALELGLRQQEDMGVQVSDDLLQQVYINTPAVLKVARVHHPRLPCGVPAMITVASPVSAEPGPVASSSAPPRTLQAG